MIHCNNHSVSVNECGSMAASAKRGKPSCDQHELLPEVPHKKPSLSEDTKLGMFLKWCEQNNFQLSTKVRVQREGSCAQYGMIAVEDIVEGYCLFQVPRQHLLMPQNCRIADIIKRDETQLAANNQWIPLLIALISEQNNPSSPWRPYLDLVPDYEALDLPMFWDKSVVSKLLKGTGVDVAIIRDTEKIEEDFNKLICPFLQRHNRMSDAPDLEHFKKLVAFVMSYSFTEPKPDDKETDSSDEDEEEESAILPPMMVPMADLLNHVTNNNAKLTFGTRALKMVTTRDVKKGEEIFNTYGQVSNLHLMHMYGFSEMFPSNTNDVVEIPILYMLEAAKLELAGSDMPEFIFDKRWAFLEEQDVLSEDEMIVLGTEGIISDDVCVQILKVLCMSTSEFEEYQDKEGWSDAESDSSLSGESKLSIEKLATVNSMWKKLLLRMASIHLSKYTTHLADDEERLKVCAELSARERFALYIAHGQKQMLKVLMETCSSKVKS